MRRNTRRTTKRKWKTVIFPRSRKPACRIESRFRAASGLALLGLFVSGMLGFGRSAAAAGSLLSGANKREKPYAVIFGTVWGPDQHPVFGVKVKIRCENEKKA